MKKNVSGQAIGAQMITRADGTNFSDSASPSPDVSVFVCGDGGGQVPGTQNSGLAVHKGNGYYEYAPSQAETNFDHVAFTFIGTGAISVTVQAYTTFPQTGDNFARLGAPAGASVSADIAAAAARLPAALVGGRIDASVGAMQNNVITAASINDGAFTSAKFVDGFFTAAKYAANAITNSVIADGALTAAKAASGFFDAVWSVTTRLLSAGTNIVLAKGVGVTGFNDVSSADVATAAAAALTAYDPPTNAEMEARTLAAASYATASDQTSIKNKTDQLTFTVANRLDTNIRNVNSVAVNGAGTVGNPWGP